VAAIFVAITDLPTPPLPPPIAQMRGDYGFAHAALATADRPDAWPPHAILRRCLGHFDIPTPKAGPAQFWGAEPGMGVTLIISDSLAPRDHMPAMSGLRDNGWMAERFVPYTCLRI
jgi:hypothetical protein